VTGAHDSAIETEVLVVGGGAAGLHVALESAEAGARTVLVSRKPLSESSSFWAQGGLAAALGADDSPERHAADTLAAGRGLCRTSAVDVLTRQAPGAVEQLQARGVRFDAEPSGELALGLEGGHSARRIVHAGGSETGRAITSRLAELVAAEPMIAVWEGASATALWGDRERCVGVVTDRGPVAARATVLATGGGAALWQRTTNPWGAIGAGAVLAKMYEVLAANDATLVEVNPLALLADGRVVALDSKVTIDDNALWRHPELESLRVTFPIDPVEARAREAGLQYVKLDGEVGIIGNGAGLVMATLDVVELAGAKPANFLDVGGGASAEVMAVSLEVILSDPSVRSVLVNIFGGITRCDVVALGILEALQRVTPGVHIVVRLDGTNAVEGRTILTQANHPRIVPAETMLEAAKRAAELAQAA